MFEADAFVLYCQVSVWFPMFSPDSLKTFKRCPIRARETKIVDESIRYVPV